MFCDCFLCGCLSSFAVHSVDISYDLWRNVLLRRVRHISQRLLRFSERYSYICTLIWAQKLWALHAWQLFFGCFWAVQQMFEDGSYYTIQIWRDLFLTKRQGQRLLSQKLLWFEHSKLESWPLGPSLFLTAWKLFWAVQQMFVRGKSRRYWLRLPPEWSVDQIRSLRDLLTSTDSINSNLFIKVNNGTYSKSFVYITVRKVEHSLS